LLAHRRFVERREEGRANASGDPARNPRPVPSDYDCLANLQSGIQLQRYA
jgi:hypothetical protein